MILGPLPPFCPAFPIAPPPEWNVSHLPHIRASMSGYQDMFKPLAYYFEGAVLSRERDIILCTEKLEEQLKQLGPTLGCASDLKLERFHTSQHASYDDEVISDELRRALAAMFAEDVVLYDRFCELFAQKVAALPKPKAPAVMPGVGGVPSSVGGLEEQNCPLTHHTFLQPKHRWKALAQIYKIHTIPKA